jgi:F0F1-type ATP synthase delta subunit
LSRVVYTTLAAITDKHQKLIDDDLQQVRVRVARPSRSPARRGKISKLRHVLGDPLVLLAEIVDRTMLGGFIVESGNLVLNASLDAQLEQIRRRLGREGARAASAMRC